MADMEEAWLKSKVVAWNEIVKAREEIKEDAENLVKKFAENYWQVRNKDGSLSAKFRKPLQEILKRVSNKKVFTYIECSPYTLSVHFKLDYKSHPEVSCCRYVSCIAYLGDISENRISKAREVDIIKASYPKVKECLQRLKDLESIYRKTKEGYIKEIPYEFLEDV